MEQKVSELELKITNIEREQERTGDTLLKISETLEKIEENQRKLISLEHEITLIKKEQEHLATMYEGKLKGVKELSNKEDAQIKEDIKEIKQTMKQVSFWLITTLATALGAIVLNLIGAK